jgi:adenylate kinase
MIYRSYQIPTASTGAILREEKRRGTELGRKADELTSGGQLVPDDLVIAVIDSWVRAHDGQFVLDGFPRTEAQALALEEILKQQQRPLDVVFSLEADEAILRERVQQRMLCSQCEQPLSIGLHVASSTDLCPHCGGRLIKRADDTLETLERRMVEYREKTQPLIRFYEGRRLLHRIDSMHAPEVVFESIKAILKAE